MDVKLKVENACGTPKKIKHTNATETTTVRGAAAIRSAHAHSIDKASPTKKHHRQQSTSVREVGSTKPDATATDRNHHRKGGKENVFSNKRKNAEQQQRALTVANPSESAEKPPVDVGSHTSEESVQQPATTPSEQPNKCHHKWCNSFSIPNTRDPRIISSAYQRQGVHSRCQKCSRYLPYEVKLAHKNKPPPSPPSSSVIAAIPTSPASFGANSIKHPPPPMSSKVKAATVTSVAPNSSTTPPTSTGSTRYTLAAPHRIKKKTETSKLAIPSILSSAKHLQQSVKASKEVVAAAAAGKTIIHAAGGSSTVPDSSSLQERKDSQPANDVNARVKLSNAAVELQQTFQNNSDLVPTKKQKTSTTTTPLTRNVRSSSLAESLLACLTSNIGDDMKSAPMTVAKPTSSLLASSKSTNNGKTSKVSHVSCSNGAESHKTKDQVLLLPSSVDTTASKLTTGQRCRAAARSKSDASRQQRSVREIHHEEGGKSPKQAGHHMEDRLKPKQAQEKPSLIKTKGATSPSSSNRAATAAKISPVCEPESAVEFYNFINPERANMLRKFMKPCYDENELWSDDSASSEKADPKVTVNGEVSTESASEKELRRKLHETALKKLKPSEFPRTTPNLLGLKSRHAPSRSNIDINSPGNNGKRPSTESCLSPNSMRNGGGSSKKPVTIPQKVFLADDGMFQQALSVSPKPQAHPPAGGGAIVPRKEGNNDKKTAAAAGDRVVPKIVNNNNEARKQIDPAKTRKSSSEQCRSNKSPKSPAAPLKATAAQSSKANGDQEGKKLKTTADEKGSIARKDEIVTTTKVAICNDDGTISVRNFVASRHNCTDSDGSNSPHRSILVQRSSGKPSKTGEQVQRKKVAFPTAPTHQKQAASVSSVESRSDNDSAVRVGAPKRARITEPPQVWKKKPNEQQRKSLDSLVEVRVVGRPKKCVPDPSKPSPAVEVAERSNKTKRGRPKKGRMTEPGKKKASKTAELFREGETAPSPKVTVSKENKPKKGAPSKVRMTEPEKKKGSKTVGDSCAPNKRTCLKSAIPEENVPKKSVPKRVRMTEPEKKKLCKTVEVPSENETMTPASKTTATKENKPKKGVSKKVRLTEPKKKKINKTVEDPLESETTHLKISTIPEEKAPKTDVPKKVRIVEPEKKKVCKTVEDSCENETTLSLKITTTSKENKPRKGAPKKVRMTEPEKKRSNKAVEDSCGIKSSPINATPQQNCQQVLAREKSADIQPSEALRGGRKKGVPNKKRITEPAKNFLPGSPRSFPRKNSPKTPVVSSLENWKTSIQNHNYKVEAASKLKPVPVDIPQLTRKKSQDQPPLPPPVTASTPLDSIKQCGSSQPLDNRNFAMFPSTAPISPEKEKLFKEKLEAKVREVRVNPEERRESTTAELLATCESLSADEAAAHVRSKKRSASSSPLWRSSEISNCKLAKANNGAPAATNHAADKKVDSSTTEVEKNSNLTQLRMWLNNSADKNNNNGVRSSSEKQSQAAIHSKSTTLSYGSTAGGKGLVEQKKSSLVSAEFLPPSIQPSKTVEILVGRQKPAAQKEQRTFSDAPKKCGLQTEKKKDDNLCAITDHSFVLPTLLRRVRRDRTFKRMLDLSFSNSKQSPSSSPKQSTVVMESLSKTAPNSVDCATTPSTSRTEPVTEQDDAVTSSTVAEPVAIAAEPVESPVVGSSVRPSSTLQLSHCTKPSTQNSSVTNSTRNGAVVKPSTQKVSASPLKLPPPIMSTGTASVIRSQQKSTTSATATRPSRIIPSRKAAILSRVEASLKELKTCNEKPPQDEQSRTTTVNNSACHTQSVVKQIVKAAESDKTDVVVLTLPFSSPIVDAGSGGKTFASMSQPRTSSAMTSTLVTETPLSKESPPSFECRNENGKRKAPQQERFDRNNDHHMPFKKRRFSREFPSTAPTKPVVATSTASATSRTSNVIDSLAPLMKTLPSIASDLLSSVPKLPHTPPSKKATRTGRPNPKSRMTLPAGGIRRSRLPVVKDSEKVVSPLKLSLKMKTAVATKGKSCTRKPLTTSSSFGCNEIKVNTDFNSLFGGVVQSGTFFTQTNNYEWSSTNPSIELIFSMPDDDDVDDGDQNIDLLAQKHHMIDVSKIGFGKSSCVPICVLKNDPRHKCCECCDVQCCTSPWVNMDLL